MANALEYKSFHAGLILRRFGLTVVTLFIDYHYTEALSLSLTSACSHVSLNQSCLFVCKVTPAAGVVGNIQFRQKSSSGPFRTVGELEQTESGCRVISNHLRGYYTKCGNGTHTFNSDVKVYSFISPTLTTDDVTDWKCIMGDVKSNIVTLKLPVSEPVPSSYRLLSPVNVVQAAAVAIGVVMLVTALFVAVCREICRVKAQDKEMILDDTSESPMESFDNPMCQYN